MFSLESVLPQLKKLRRQCIKALIISVLERCLLPLRKSHLPFWNSKSSSDRIISFLTEIRKTNTKSIIGPSGTREILASISDVPAVAIGGINLANVQKVIQQSRTSHRALNGVAVVSAIMAAENPETAAQDFTKLIRNPRSLTNTAVPARPDETQILEESVPLIVEKMVVSHPLVHNMINFVVANFAANVALAMLVFSLLTVTLLKIFTNTNFKNTAVHLQ
jgi:hypothetical protein